jgi:hypothetical protein
VFAAQKKGGMKTTLKKEDEVQGKSVIRLYNYSGVC